MTDNINTDTVNNDESNQSIAKRRKIDSTTANSTNNTETKSTPMIGCAETKSAAWAIFKPTPPKPKITKGVLARYAKCVTSADKGAVLMAE